MPRARRTADVRLSLSVKAAPGEVYRALTSARELCVWYVDRAETDARNLGRWRMEWPAGGPGRREAAGVFVDLEPGRKVALMEDARTLPKGLPPLVTFFIEERGRGAQVTVVHAGFPSPALAGAWRERWEDCLAKLRLYLETGRGRKDQVLSLAAAAPRR